MIGSSRSGPVLAELALVVGLVNAVLLVAVGLTPRDPAHVVMWIAANAAAAQLPLLRRGLGPDTRRSFVAFLLIFHLGSRWSVERSTPLAERPAYQQVLRVALNLVRGEGFTCSPLPRDPTAEPIREFFELQRAALSDSELQAYFDRPFARPLQQLDARPELDLSDREEELLRFIPVQAEGRTLEVRFTALLWRLFGVRWSVVFGVYVLASGLAAGLLFDLVRRAWGYWAGAAALALYTATPLEGDYAVRCFRDITPLWFTVLAFWAVVRCASLASPLGLAAGSALAGAASCVGLGWRPDVMLLVPFLALTLCLLVATRLPRRSSGTVARSLVAFVVGAVTMVGVTRAAGGGATLDSQTGFHIAVYGHSARCRLLEVENSYQAFRCDIQTNYQVRDFAERRGMPDGARPMYGRSYALACRALALDVAEREVFHLVRGLPGFLVRSLRATHLEDLPIEGRLPPPSPDRWTSFCRSRLVLRLGLALTAIGLFGCMFVASARAAPLAAVVTLFWAFYAVVMLLVLPEYKHAGMLVLSKCALGGLGVATVLQALRGQAPERRRVRIGLAVLVALGATWAAALGGSWLISRARRGELVEALERLPTTPVGPAEVLLGEHFASVPSVSGGAVTSSVGYRFDIETDAPEATLVCRHVRRGGVGMDTALVWGSRERVMESRHRVTRGRSSFYVFPFSGRGQGDTRDYTCALLLEPTARLRGVRRFSTASWDGPIVSTIVTRERPSAGSPRGPADASRLVWPACDYDLFGLSIGERSRDPRLALIELGVNPVRGRLETVPDAPRPSPAGLWATDARALVLEGTSADEVTSLPIETAAGDLLVLIELTSTDGQVALGARSETGELLVEVPCSPGAARLSLHVRGAAPSFRLFARSVRGEGPWRTQVESVRLLLIPPFD